MWTPMSNEMFNCVGMLTLITNKAEPLLPVTASVPSNTCQIELFICKEITSTMNADIYFQYIYQHSLPCLCKTEAPSCYLHFCLLSVLLCCLTNCLLLNFLTAAISHIIENPADRCPAQTHTRYESHQLICI